LYRAMGFEKRNENILNLQNNNLQAKNPVKQINKFEKKKVIK